MVCFKLDGWPLSARDLATMALLIAAEYCKATIERCEAANIAMRSRKLRSVVFLLCKASLLLSDISW